MKQVGIVEYGAGNLGNVMRALKRLGRSGVLLESPDEIPESVSTIVLPGVGAFGPAMDSLRKKGWDRALIEWADRERPLLGICLGMQLFAEGSDENGSHRGLGLIEGKSEKLDMTPLPHMGWNDISTEDPILKPFDGSYLYFVHSYGLKSSKNRAATTEAGNVVFVSAVRKGSVMGLQFHPERSGDVGHAMLDRILEELGR